MSQGFIRTSDLSEVAPLFPLSGVILLPRAQLPLNIFEPRYLNMVDDAMGGDRMIVMVQTTGGTQATPGLAAVGCAGRITSFAETSDGRYLITLTGVCRARIGAEIPGSAPYRQARLDYAPYEIDLRPGDDEAPGVDRARLAAALKGYLNRRALDVDWEAVETAPPEPLVNSLSIALPFDPAEKQLLLEAADVAERAAALTALLEIETANPDDGAPPSMQ